MGKHGWKELYFGHVKMAKTIFEARVGQGKSCEKSEDCEGGFCHHWEKNEDKEMKTSYCMRCESIVILNYKCSDWKILSAEGKKQCEKRCSSKEDGDKNDAGSGGKKGTDEGDNSEITPMIGKNGRKAIE